MQYPFDPHFVHQWLDACDADEKWHEAQVVSINSDENTLTVHLLGQEGNCTFPFKSSSLAPYLTRANPFPMYTPEGKHVKDWNKVRKPCFQAEGMLVLDEQFNWRMARLLDVTGVPDKPSLKMFHLQYEKSSQEEWIYSNSKRLSTPYYCCFRYEVHMN